MITFQAETANTSFISSTACPFKVIEACRRCWNNKTLTKRQSAADRCWLNHPLSDSVVFILMPDEIEIRPLPTQCRSRQFEMCRHIQRISYCTYPGCKFAHSEAELKLWRWMAKHQGNSYLYRKLLFCVV